MAIFIDALLAGMLLWAFTNDPDMMSWLASTHPLLPTIIGWLWPLYTYYFLRTILRSTIASQRIQHRAYSDWGRPSLPSLIASSSINYELDQVDQTKLIEDGEGWRLYDATFDFYRHTKNGKYLSKHAYYTVYEAKLSRKAPNIIFDGKSAKRRQFRHLYLQSQRVSLEGNFDQYFDTYVSLTYHIDLLSFITPEVMQALIQAQNYDIEVVGDRVLVYAPLLDNAGLSELKNLGENIARNLNDNLDTYRDDRLAGEYRTSYVTPFARHLLKSPMKEVPIMLLSGLAIATLVYLSIMYDTPNLLYSNGAFVAYLWFGISTYSFVKILVDNHRLETNYRASLAA